VLFGGWGGWVVVVGAGLGGSVWVFVLGGGGGGGLWEKKRSLGPAGPVVNRIRCRPGLLQLEDGGRFGVQKGGKVGEAKRRKASFCQWLHSWINSGIFEDSRKNLQ